MKIVVLILSLAGVTLLADVSQAKIKVVATTTTLKSLAESIGGDLITANSLTSHKQDPHFVSAKPSYMVQLRNADLLLTVGLELEVGWVGSISRGAKNPKILRSPGLFVAGNHITPIEIPKGKIDRSMGDVHSEGNPHFHLDPLQTKKVAKALLDRFSQIDHDNESLYQENYDLFAQELDIKLKDWTKRVAVSRIKNVITYHKSFNYFLDRFNIGHAHYIEPKPGVPPTAKHIQTLIKNIQSEKIKCLLNESYFSSHAAEKLRARTAIVVKKLNVEVSTDYFDLIESVVKALEDCASA